MIRPKTYNFKSKFLDSSFTCGNTFLQFGVAWDWIYFSLAANIFNRASMYPCILLAQGFISACWLASALTISRNSEIQIKSNLHTNSDFRMMQKQFSQYVRGWLDVWDVCRGYPYSVFVNVLYKCIGEHQIRLIANCFWVHEFLFGPHDIRSVSIQWNTFDKVHHFVFFEHFNFPIAKSVVCLQLLVEFEYLKIR